MPNAVRHAVSRSTGSTTWTRKDGDEWQDDLPQPRGRHDRQGEGRGLEERLDPEQLLRQVQVHRRGEAREDHRWPAGPAHPHQQGEGRAEEARRQADREEGDGQ